MKRTLTFALAVTGSVWVFLFTVIGGAMFEGYSHVSQFISELGARDAPNEYLIRFGGFLPTAVFLSVFAILAHSVLPRSRKCTFGFVGIFVFSFTYLVAVFFPCDPGCRPIHPSTSQTLHNLIGFMGYLLVPLSLGLLGASAKTWNKGKTLSLLGSVGAVTSLIGLLTLTPESPYVGVSQRMLEASLLAWIVACGIYVRKQ